MAVLRKYDVKLVEPTISSAAFGSKNHITKGYYAGYERVALKKIEKFKDDSKFIDLKKELDFIKKLNKCDNTIYM
jgi:hypothetical protein